MSRELFATLLLTFSLTITACTQDKQEENRVVDSANIVHSSKEKSKAYKAFNDELLKDFDIDFRVQTYKTNEDINLYANREFHKIETKSKSGKTLLLVINPDKDKVRLEVSMALEPVYTDAFVSYIEQKGMLPYFQDNKVADGIYMMSELIRDRATEAKNAHAFMPAMQNKSIGAGAKTDAKIAQKDKDAKSGSNIEASSFDTPDDILEKYFQSLREHNKNPNLDIFTKDTKKFFSKWTVTDINQNNELRFASHCQNRNYYTEGDYAVLLYTLEPRTCSPYLFKKEDGVWRIDIATMAKTLRFNKDMMWHFDMNKKTEFLSPYEFAFKNFNYDTNGYPFYKKRENKKLKWGFTCSGWYIPGEKDKIRCWISWLDSDGRAKNDLGLREYDRVMALGEGQKRVENPSLKEMMRYMKETPRGDKVVLEVIRENKLKKLNAIAR